MCLIMTTATRTPAQSPSRRPALVLALFLLAPLVGEFLLGNLPITWLGALVMLAPLYGGGAVLIREIARRSGRGWPTMIVLGFVYALIEEAFVTQSLFNPDYVGLRLLDFGYIPSLGIGAWWTVFVLGIHTIWSTAVPIALVETLAGRRDASRQPWLGRIGLTVMALVFAAGCAVTAAVQPPNPTGTSPAQFLGAGAVAAVCAVVAFGVGRRQRSMGGQDPTGPADADAGPAAPSVPFVVGASFAAGSVFMILAFTHEGLPAVVSVAAMLATLAAGGIFLAVASRRRGWSGRHVFAAAVGFLLTYVWYGFVQVPSIGAPSAAVNLVGDIVFASGALTLVYVLARRLRATAERAGPGFRR